MKHSFLISIIFGLIYSINIYSVVNSEIKVSVEQKKSEGKSIDINSTAITLETLQQLLKDPRYAKGKEKAKIIIRINALKNFQRGYQPTIHGLSEAQAKIIREIFALNDSEESVRRQHLLKGQEKLKNIQSFDDFKRVAMDIINNK